LSKFHLAPSFDEEDFRHWFYPRAGIVDCFVVEQDGVITDMVSYYTLPSTVMHHPVHKSLKAAYSFYNASSSTPWQQLMSDALVTAKNSGFDVFNALDLMDNKTFLEPLKFGIGDGNLHYYLYNWRCPQMQANQVGLVLQ
jgi:glycylpeptide N-tetradecanoyltransferase